MHCSAQLGGIRERAWTHVATLDFIVAFILPHRPVNGTPVHDWETELENTYPKCSLLQTWLTPRKDILAQLARESPGEIYHDRWGRRSAEARIWVTVTIIGLLRKSGLRPREAKLIDWI